MDDLDSLLEDLGRGKTTSSSKPATSASSRPASTTTRPVSSRVDLNELEDLMTDLAAPTAKKAPEPTPVATPQTSQFSDNTQTRPVSTFNANGNSSSYSQPEPPPQSSAPPPSNNTVDDLEALMESLNVTSNSRSSRRQPASRTSEVPKDPTPVARESVVVARDPVPVARDPVPVARDPVPVARDPTPAPVKATAVNNTPAKTAPVKGDDLDKLLSNLTSQMDNIDAENPASRGQCATCKGAIIGEMMQALGRCYHPEHFQCGNCNQPLGTKNFFEQNGLPHCGDCYTTMYCPKCAHCNSAILDRCITALGKKWHPEHFICAQCLQPFPAGNFFERDGRPYCENDFFALFASKCGACHEPIKGDCINALGQQWHPEHFVCTYCGKAFTGTFFEHSGKPYCEAHYHQQSGSCCGGCGKPITGRCVNALEKKWHPEHFVCAFCMNPLAGGSFTEKNNKAYCKECYSKLFGS